MKGIFEFEVEGKKVGFKLGTYALSIACEKEGGCDVDVLLKRCGQPYLKDGKIACDKPKLKALLHLFYGAAIHYAEDNDITDNIKVSTVSNWLDNIGAEKLNEMITEGFKQPEVPKNSTSLAETREPVSV